MKVPVLVTVDKSNYALTTGVQVLSPNANRYWASFVNQGPSDVDLNFIVGSIVTGRIRLKSGMAFTMSKHGPCEWYGALSATGIGAATYISGVECYEVFPGDEN